MRTALISDIHGDLKRLIAVLADIEKQNCARILCLGDVVNGSEDNEEVVQHLMASKILCVQGNHDIYPSVHLPPELYGILRSWPEEIIEGDVIFTHVSPRIKKRKVKTDFEVWNVFDEVAFRRVFIGDVHIPMLWGERFANPVSAKRYEISYGDPFNLALDDRYLICVGAVGYSRDGDERPRYVIYDDESDSVTFRVV
ncbi:MAG TPA: metallophosphoesterase family protein [Abditibacteriaceae bacterium]|jgi:hypothetical protein